MNVVIHHSLAIVGAHFLVHRGSKSSFDVDMYNVYEHCSPRDNQQVDPPFGNVCEQVPTLLRHELYIGGYKPASAISLEEIVINSKGQHEHEVALL